MLHRKEVVFETRLEFLTNKIAKEIATILANKKIHILTGFETYTPEIRDNVLGKREPLEFVFHGIENVGKSHFGLIAYILYKPVHNMIDDEADIELKKSIDWLIEACNKNKVTLSLRLNPMYVSAETVWAKSVNHDEYQVPSLKRLYSIASYYKTIGIDSYIGLSSEGLADDLLTYRSHTDYTKDLLKQVICFNRL